MDFASPSAENSKLPYFELELKNQLEDLETLSQWLAEISDQVQLSPKGTFRLELALEEAVTNVMQHAYGDDQTEHAITINLQCQGKTIEAQIRDDGQPFDPLQQPEIVLPTSLEDAREGGLGIHLIRNYADECHYQREGDFNVLTIVISDTDQPTT